MIIHIQIILYNSSPVLPLLIKSFNLVDVSFNKFFIHFLENSEEKTQTVIENCRPKFKYSYDFSNENTGFAKGHNQIFKKYSKSYAKLFMVMNPDVIVYYDFLTNLSNFIEKLQPTWGAIDLHQLPQEHPKNYRNDYQTEWVSCAAAIFKTKIFKQLKGFDESFFMYGEDVDLSWRIMEAGFNLFHCPFSKIIHTIGFSSRDESETEHGSESSFQRIHSLAANLYLRHKYFGENDTRVYKKAISSREEFGEVIDRYAKMKKNLRPAEGKKCQKFHSPKIYPDTNYALHRW